MTRIDLKTAAPACASVSSDAAGPPQRPEPSLKPKSSRPTLITGFGWLTLTAIIACFLTLHWQFLLRAIRIATDAEGNTFYEVFKNAMSSTWNKDWSHTLVIPFISLFYILANRQKLTAQRRTVFWPGLLLMFAGIGGYIFWIFPGRVHMLQGWSMILTLLGATLLLLGPRPIKVLWFPIFFLVFAAKLPEAAWSTLAWRLQLLAAKSSTFVLQLLGLIFGFDAENRGSTIDLIFLKNGAWVTEGINVEEACSGMRMLMAFIALATAMAFFMNRPLWQRLVVMAMSVPIAIAVNVGRVIVIGLLYMKNPELARGDFHIMVGLLMLGPAALLCLAVGWVMDKMVIAEPMNRALPTETQAKPRVDPSWIPAVNKHSFASKLAKLAQGAAGGAVLTGLVALLAGSIIVAYSPAELGFEATLRWRILSWATALTALAVIGFLLAQTRRQIAGDFLLARRFTTGLVLGVLLTAALGFDQALDATQAVLFKDSVPLRRPLYRVASETPGWVMAADVSDMSEDMEEALGTKLHLTRVYAPKGSNFDPDMSRRGLLSADDIGVRLHVAYYTGTVDMVPHVPDVCYIAGGHERVAVSRDAQFDLPDGDLFEIYRGAGEQLEGRIADAPYWTRVPQSVFDATRFTFAPRTGDSELDHQNVFYFFAANGKFMPSPDDVRVDALDIRQRYSYYCKIEVGVFALNEKDAELQHRLADPTEALKVANDFLTSTMPEILACLPDWREVEQGLWPPPKHTAARSDFTK